ncbi:MAG: hypothetical protein ABI151_02580 [Chitinophagaceae bacterium]
MRGSVKSKIRAGSAFLFLLVMISGGVSLYFIVKFRLESKNLLQANYKSIEYAHIMQRQLDSIENGSQRFVDSFAIALSRQEKNITENGEMETTRGLRNAFQQ